jgi:hypothetical protein
VLAPSADQREKCELVARGQSCPECRSPMYAQKEDYQPKGTWVTYVCRNGRCSSVIRGYPASERKFEGN